MKILTILLTIAALISTCRSEIRITNTTNTPISIKVLYNETVTKKTTIRTYVSYGTNEYSENYYEETGEWSTSGGMFSITGQEETSNKESEEVSETAANIKDDCIIINPGETYVKNDETEESSSNSIEFEEWALISSTTSQGWVTGTLNYVVFTTENYERVHTETYITTSKKKTYFSSTL